MSNHVSVRCDICGDWLNSGRPYVGRDAANEEAVKAGWELEDGGGRHVCPKHKKEVEVEAQAE